MRLWQLQPESLSADAIAPDDETREITVWDLGGQKEYRIVHQLFLHDTNIALTLLDPTRDAAFDGADDWNVSLEKQIGGRNTTRLLVGAKSDEINHQLIDKSRIDAFTKKWRMSGFCLTSAKHNKGIDELRGEIARLIDWKGLSRTSTPKLFQKIRAIVDEARADGEIVLLRSDLENRLKQIEPEEFSAGAVNTVLEHLARQGAITDTRLSTGDRALVLQIGYVDIYAGSLILIAREAARTRGVPAIELSDAIFRKSFPGIETGDRLAPLQERQVMECVIELMIDKGLCLKQERLLIFPDLFPAEPAGEEDSARRAVSLFYDFSGAISNIYSSLVARLALSERFGRVRLWKHRAEFDRPGHGVCGLRRIDRPGGWSHLDLLFQDDTDAESRDLFTVFVEEHLSKQGVTIREVLEMECSKCGYRLEEALVREYIARGFGEISCPFPGCGNPNRISAGAAKARTASPTVTNQLVALKKTIERRQERDSDEAKQEARVRAFISYSHNDEVLRVALGKHLTSLRREGIIDVWHDRMIAPGIDWAKEIDMNLDSASLVLLLVSSDFIDSDYCIGKEMRRALERHLAKKARVIPVILRPAEWQRMPFSSFQALPKDGKPVTTWANQDEAFLDVVRGVRQAVSDFLRPDPQGVRPTVSVSAESVPMPVVQATPLRILHLTDLHFRQGADPDVYLQPLIHDLRDTEEGFGINELDYLVISGDISNRASEEEFEIAHKFMSGLMSRFSVASTRCVITPGNHDLNWEVTAYDWQPKRKVEPAKLATGSYVEQGSLYGLRDDSAYPKRFENFQRFYHQLTQQPYPLKPETQFMSFLYEEHALQFLALNSAWEIDEYFPERSSINHSALVAGLRKANEQIESAHKDGRLEQSSSVFRIATWHHPITGNEKIQSDAFMDQLRKADFKLCLHGHIHEDRADLVGYLHPRRIYVVGAGSFGATAGQRPESTPRLYNLIEVWRDHSKIRVYTRCLMKEGGAWEPWARWPNPTGGDPISHYDIDPRRA